MQKPCTRCKTEEESAFESENDSVCVSCDETDSDIENEIAAEEHQEKEQPATHWSMEFE